MMTGFKRFLLETDIKEEVKETIAKLPKSHQKLVKGYKFKFESGCTLKGSEENIGMIHLNNDKKKEIHVAAPWNFSRAFTFLHEIGHLVWENLMTKELKSEWAEVVKNTKKKAKQSVEELFCHSYACHYTGEKCVKIHDHPEWHEFVKEKIPG